MDTALKFEEDNLSENIVDGIDINELKRMNTEIINEANRLTKNASAFFKRTSNGEDISKEETQEQAKGWKRLKEMEKCYSFLLKKAKQKGVKQKDIEGDSNTSPDIDKIKENAHSIGAIVRKIS